jgi:hypothetical protein
MENDKFFCTSDIYLASFLAAHDLPVKLETKNPTSSKIIFVFDKIDQVYRLIADFTGNGTAPIQDFVEAYKTLRTQMYSLSSNHGVKVAR